jgi:DNA-binding PadR family transcriptional regulator
MTSGPPTLNLEKKEGRAVSLRFGVLGLIASKPMSGYDLMKQFERSLRYVWHATHSQIYPELRRLLDEGLIRIAELGGRGRKTYAITEEGIRALRGWLTNTEPDRAERDEAYLRMFFLWLLPEEEAQAFLRREIEWHRGGLERFEEISDSPSAPWGRIPVELGIRYKRMMLDYLEWASREIAGA